MEHASNFENIRIDANMLGLNTFYQTQLVEYSIDGTFFNEVGAFNLEQDSSWYSGTFELPEEANRQQSVFVRFKADDNSNLILNGVTGTSISEILVLADPAGPTAIDEHKEEDKRELEVIEELYFSLDGKRLESPVNGINIVVRRYQDGSVSAKKVFIMDAFE